MVEDYADWLEEGRREEGTSFPQEYHDYSITGCCSHCDRNFESKEALRRHLRSPIHYPWVYKCPDCSTQFSVLSGLVQHVESDACNEGIHDGTGAVGKMLHYLELKL